MGIANPLALQNLLLCGAVFLLPFIIGVASRRDRHDPDEIDCPNYNDTKGIMYLRVGKAGSTSLKQWFVRQKFLRPQTARFDAPEIHEVYAQYKVIDSRLNKERLTLEEEGELAKEFWAEKAARERLPLVYMRHIHFVNFTRHGLEQPHSITILRDPAQRYISQYHYWRTLRSMKASLQRHNVSLMQCLRSQEQLYGCPEVNYQTSYLCGHGPHCAVPPDKKTFQLAKHNLFVNIAVPCLTENITLCTQVVQRVFPGLFVDRNPPRMFNQLKVKPSISEEELSLAKERNMYDMYLYELAKQLMDRLRRVCGVKSVEEGEIDTDRERKEALLIAREKRKRRSEEAESGRQKIQDLMQHAPQRKE